MVSEIEAFLKMWSIFFNDIFFVFDIVHDIKPNMKFCVNTPYIKK